MSPSKSTSDFQPLFGSLFENSPDGVILGEPNGTALRANPAACRMLGRSEEEVVRLGRSGVVVEDAALREWVAARNRDGVAKGVLHYRKADGSVFPVDVTSAVVPGPEGKERAYIIFRDITERVLAEQGLRAAHERLRRAEEFASFGHWEFSIDEKIMHASEGAARLYGTAKADIPLAEIQGWVLAGYRPALDSSLRDLIEHGAPYDQEFKIRRASDGAIVDIHSKAEFDAHTGRVFGVIQDITKRKKAEEALAANERLYRSLIEVSPSAIVIIRNGNLEVVNRALLEASGYDLPDQLVGKSLNDILTPESAKRTGEGIATMLSGGKVGIVEVQVLAKDGSVRLMEAASALCPDQRGPVIQMALRDITEQRAMQEQLQVTSRLAALGTLVAGVAHEINNPLAVTISGQDTAMEYLRKLRDRASRKEAIDLDELVRDLDEHVGVLTDARIGAQRIARIVKDLTSFGRPDPRRARVRLIDVVEESMQWLPGSVVTCAIIDVENREGPDVVASVAQMGQVLVNLVTNATKSIPENHRGIITIRVGAGRPGTACVEVTDNGSGMSPEVMARIFDPFFTTREVGQGTGLGLSISHAIVTSHGGTLTVESEVGKGSTFRVELPAAPAEA